jgi:hypothetical protein
MISAVCPLFVGKVTIQCAVISAGEAEVVIQFESGTPFPGRVPLELARKPIPHSN